MCHANILTVCSLGMLVMAGRVDADPIPISIPPVPISHPTNDNDVAYGDAYGIVHFEIEQFDAPAQPIWLRSLVEKVFGVATDGEYIVALELLDPSKNGNDQLIARKIIAHFIKKSDGSVLTDLL